MTAVKRQLTTSTAKTSSASCLCALSTLSHTVVALVSVLAMLQSQKARGKLL
jgi:hypothetical protein